MEAVANKEQTSKVVFLISAALCGTIAVWGLISPASMTGIAQAVTNFCLTSLGWFYLLLGTSLLIMSIYMAFGPYGDIVLGGDDEEPEFTLVSWLAMLFSAGMGAGLIFWGVAEPIFHFVSPPGMERADQSMRLVHYSKNYLYL